MPEGKLWKGTATLGVGWKKKDQTRKKTVEQIIHLCQVQTKTIEVEGLKLYISIIRDEVDLDSIWLWIHLSKCKKSA